jgi:very-short-patch-repair endonuclease
MATILAPRSRDAAIIRLAMSQEQVVAVRQLRAMGMSNDAIHRRVDAGMLSKAFSGVYAVAIAPDELTRAGWTHAALLRHRGVVAATSGTAATQLGIWTREDRHAPIRIVTTSTGGSVPGGPARPRIEVRRTAYLPSSDIVMVDQMLVTSACRTLLDASRAYEPLQLTAMIDDACYLEILDLDELRIRLDESRRVAGTANLRAALDWYERGSAGTRSRSEDELLRRMLEARLPMPLVNVRGAAGLHGLECDFVWYEQRVIVEVDGRHHAQSAAAAQDALRDEALRADGWQVVRIPHTLVWRQPRRAVALVAAALACG